jgi:hypothetical protein
LPRTGASWRGTTAPCWTRRSTSVSSETMMEGGREEGGREEEGGRQTKRSTERQKYRRTATEAVTDSDRGRVVESGATYTMHYERSSIEGYSSQITLWMGMCSSNK